MAHSLKIKNYHFCPIFNVCHQVYFQKNLKNRFREKFKNIDLGHKNSSLIPFWVSQEFSLKTEFCHF